MRGCDLHVLGPDEVPSEDAEMLLCVGGDGTFLSSAALAAERGLPVMGVNLGRLGFLSENRPEDVAKAIMSKEIAALKDKKFPQSMLYYYEEDGVKELATAIVGHWQQNFSTFINIESSDNLAVMQQELEEKTLDFALFPVMVRSNDFSEYAKNFAFVTNAKTPQELQQELISNYSILPVAYQTTDISYISSLENVNVREDNGYIDFSNIIKR